MRTSFLAAAALAAVVQAATAGTGVTTLPARAGDAPVTVFYPAAGADRPVQRGPFALALAADAPGLPGNGRLVVVSHGSGGSPWVHAELARALIDAGFTVAAPRHRGDHAGDDGDPGPASWVLRPGELSRAIDAVAADPRFAGVRTDRVGVFGMSAGGHTALVMAGGRWSPARLRDHCIAHIADDFPTCAGLSTALTGGPLDAVRRAAVLAVHRARFDDATPQGHHDPRVAAVVAAVPLAADFDLATLAAPRVPLALATAAQDRWLAHRFHAGAVLAACPGCETVAALPTGGHGAYLDPLPAGLDGAAAALLNDPPGFDRAGLLPGVHAATAAFFRRHLRP